jgi:CheY-like chemotaxis protein
MSDKKKVMVVDDVPMNRKILKLWFERHDLEVVMASNGDEAIEVFYKEVPDVTFMDINMPKKDGKIATEVIKVSHPEAVVFALSTDPCDMHQQADGGYKPFDDYLQKPINFSLIKSLLKDYQFELEDEV